jgi:hypothetical protein
MREKKIMGEILPNAKQSGNCERRDFRKMTSKYHERVKNAGKGLETGRLASEAIHIFPP